MIFSVRKDVSLTGFQNDLAGFESISIELALPHNMQEFLSTIGRLNELKEYVHNKGLLVRSVHAPHGRLSGNAFLSWAPTVVKFAQNVGGSTVVFHPENHIAKARKPRFQATALSHIKALQEKTSVTIAIETFRSNSRLFTPGEIVEHNLPMVLDTSHIGEQYTFELIQGYSGNIVGVHLSGNRMDPESGKVLNHLPVEEFGISVLETLRNSGWNGSVTLEYLPSYHDRLIHDREKLEGMFG